MVVKYRFWWANHTWNVENKSLVWYVEKKKKKSPRLSTRSNVCNHNDYPLQTSQKIIISQTSLKVILMFHVWWGGGGKQIMFAISLFLGLQRFLSCSLLLWMKKIHRAFNTFYLPAKNPFSAVEGEVGAKFVANSIPDTVRVHQVDFFKALINVKWTDKSTVLRNSVKPCISNIILYTMYIGAYR